MVGTNRQSGGVSAEKGEKRVILSFTCNGLTRRIQRVENAVVAVRQDSNVDTVRMIFRPEEFNNIPLSTVSVKFLYVDTDGEIKAYQTGTTPDGGVYVADWELTDDVVDDAGYINFAVKLAVVNGDAVEKQWFSIPDTFRVYDSVDDTNNPPGETAAEQATNAEKIAQLQSQLGTATSELEGLTNTVALHGAALDTIGTNTWALRGGTAIPANENIDNYFTEGNYGVQSSATARTLSGLPFETGSGNIFAFTLKVENAALNDNSARRQILQFYNDRQQWIRYGSVNGTWTAWERQPSRAEIASYKNLGASTAIPSNSDLDNYTTPGSYSAQSNAIAATITNAPITRAFTLDVENALGLASSAWRRQIVRASASPDDVYQRFTGGNTWSDWEKVPTRAEIDPLINAESNTAGYHNGIYRGKDITAYLTDGTLWKRINGTGGFSLFEDLFLGDYITVGNNSYAIVDFDYYYRGTYTDLNVHHIVMMPVGAMNIPAGTTLYGTSDTLTFINTANAGQTVTSQESATAFKWNATMSDPNTNTTNGGYKYSRVRTVIMKAANTIVIDAFGAEHVKPLGLSYPNPASETATAFTGADWFTNADQSNIMSQSICDLPNETQVYGAQVWGQWNSYNGMGYEVGCDKWQFAIFKLQRNFGSYRDVWWLRSVASASSAALVYYAGDASYSVTASARGVRPRFVLVG